MFKYIVLVLSVGLVVWLIFNQLFFYLGIYINDKFIAIVIFVSQVISFLFAIVSIINNLYLSKDNELLLVLPVSFNQLFVSKIILLYLNDLIFGLKFYLPIFITLGIMGNLSITYYFMVLPLIFLLPIFPLSVGALISIPIMFVVKYLRKHTVISITIILVTVALVFVVYMNIVTKISGAFNVAEKQVETSIKVNQYIYNLGKSIPLYNFVSLSLFNIKYSFIEVIFGLTSLVIMLLCFFIIKPYYYRVATLSLEQVNNVKSKYIKFKKRSVFTELLVNEFRVVFRSSGYVFGYFLFPLFMPLIVFTYDKLLISIAVNQAGKSMILGSHMLILCLISLMSNIISSIAISKEGNTFYIAKTTPVSFYTQIKAKLVFNLIITISAIFITTLLSLILTDLNRIFILCSGVISSILSIGHISHSLDYDLMVPTLDWYDNSEISTLSKNTTKSIIMALVLSVFICLIFVFVNNIIIAVILSLIISTIYTLLRLHLLYIKTEYYYHLMEI